MGTATRKDKKLVDHIKDEAEAVAFEESTVPGVPVREPVGALTLSEAWENSRKRERGDLPPLNAGKADKALQDDDVRMEKGDSPDQVGGRGVALQHDTEDNVTGPELVRRENYMKKRGRVNFELDNGTYSIPAVDVKASRYGVAVLLPYNLNDATFTPNPGTAVRIIWDGASWDCYFPGTSFELPELGLLMLTMVKSTVNNNEGG